MKASHLLIAALLAVATGGTAHANRKIDAFTDPFPPQTLPGTSLTTEMLWVGTLNGVTKPEDKVSQSGLPGVMGGKRVSDLVATTPSNLVTTTVFDGSLSYAAGTGKSGKLVLEYGGTPQLNKNLSSELAFELEINGDMDDGSPVRPVLLTTTVRSNSVTASTTTTVNQDGRYYVEFSRFPGVNFADVDFVEFHFNASQVQAIDFRLQGELRASACIR